VRPVLRYLGFLGLLSASLVFAIPGGAAADDYPAKSVRLLVPYPAGGPNDVLARLIGQKLAVSLGKPVVVDNKPGASTMVANEAVARATPDGYTLLFNNSTLATTTVLYKHAPYRLDDFTAIAPVANAGLMLTVPLSLPVKSVAELVGLAKASPGKLNYASSGRGGATHLTSEHFKRVAGLDVVGIEYRGSAVLMGDLVAGDVQFYFYPVTGSLEYIRSGQIRALGVTSDQRLPAAPDIPTFKELGYPAMVATIAYGIFGPAALPKPIVERLNADIAAAVNAPDVQARIVAEGGFPMTASPERYAAFFRENLAFWSQVIQPLGLELD
jgi:tripartite-type tricarboxylate transporter receptor subunit TctC